MPGLPDASFARTRHHSVKVGRAARRNEPIPNDTETFGTVLKHSEARKREAEEDSNSAERVEKLKEEVVDLKILNKGKDFLIEQLRKEREGLLSQVVDYSRQVGQLETKLLQLSAPQNPSE